MLPSILGGSPSQHANPNETRRGLQPQGVTDDRGNNQSRPSRLTGKEWELTFTILSEFQTFESYSTTPRSASKATLTE